MIAPTLRPDHLGESCLALSPGFGINRFAVPHRWICGLPHDHDGLHSYERLHLVFAPTCDHFVRATDRLAGLERQPRLISSERQLRGMHPDRIVIVLVRGWLATRVGITSRPSIDMLIRVGAPVRRLEL